MYLVVRNRYVVVAGRRSKLSTQNKNVVRVCVCWKVGPTVSRFAAHFLPLFRGSQVNVSPSALPSALETRIAATARGFKCGGSHREVQFEPWCHC